MKQWWLCFGVFLVGLAAGVAAEPSRIVVLQQQLQEVQDKNKVDTLNELSEAYWGKSSEDSLNYAIQAQELAKSLGYRAGEAHALRHIAVAKWYQDDYDAVLRYAFDALAIFRQLDDKPGIAACLNTIATTYLNLDKFDDAESIYLEALAIAREIKHVKREATVLQNLGTISIGKEQFSKALEYLNPALALARAHGSELQVMTVLANIGSVHMRTGEFDNARAINLQVLELAQRTGSKTREADALSDLGRIEYEQQQYPTAISYMEKAIALSREEAFKRTLIDTHRYLSLAYQGQGNYPKALEALQQYISLRETVLNEENNQKISELQVRFDVERKQLELDRQRMELAQNRNILFLSASVIVLMATLIMVGVLAYRVKVKANFQLSELARTDELTKLPNRRAALESLAKLKSEQKRRDGLLAVILLDIDHFKKINDTYGHDQGDLALKHYSHAIKCSIREIDLAARWGGEEFLLVMPIESVATASDVVNRIRTYVRDNPLTVNGVTIPLTATFGLAVLTADVAIDSALKRADEALYRGKHNGRDRLETDGAIVV